MSDPAELYAQLTTAFNQRAWRQARELAARLLPVASRHAGVHYIAGIASMELRDFPPAVEYLRRAAVLEPERADFAAHFAKVLARVGRNQEAKVTADRARTRASGDPATLDTLGVIYTQLRDYDSAAAMFRDAAALMPQHAPFRYNLATSLIAAGAIDAAEVELEACLALEPRHWLSHLTLAQLRRQTPAHHHIERLESLLEEIGRDAPDTEALMSLNMALAKEYEDLADYPRSFDHLVHGKSAGAARHDYSIERDEALFAAIIASFPDPLVTAVGHPSAEPIFIIGMPRSGTTLVERIISSHPDVKSVGELMNFGMVLKQMSGSRTPALVDADTIERSRDIDWARLGAIYLSSTRPATGQKPYFVDKLPHNFLYAGHIARALPNARIVCLRRNPMDTCLSNFRQLFMPNSAYFDYSFDLLDTGRYYVLFDRLINHWQRVLPGRILTLDYETLVDSQEASSRRLLEFCGLSWHEDCLSFENNSAPVATASAVQVRERINRRSLGRWKKYESQLKPLRDLLIAAGVKLTP